MVILWATTFYIANAKQNSLSEIGHFMIILWATTLYNTKANPKYHKVRCRICWDLGLLAPAVLWAPSATKLGPVSQRGGAGPLPIHSGAA